MKLNKQELIDFIEKHIDRITEYVNTITSLDLVVIDINCIIDVFDINYFIIKYNHITKDHTSYEFIICDLLEVTSNFIKDVDDDKIIQFLKRLYVTNNLLTED